MTYGYKASSSILQGLPTAKSCRTRRTMPVSFIALAGWHDVFQEILNHLEPTDHYDEDDENDRYFAARKAFKGALFSLALSSHALSGPALDKLWRSLTDISPLFKLLPNYQLRGLTYHIMGYISPEAWSRFQTYASRVRNITVHRHIYAHPSVWTVIHEQSQGGPLFPNLSSLYAVIWSAPHAVSSIRLFISPSLKSVSLAFHGVPGGLQPTDAAITVASDSAASILQDLSVKSPKITRLFVLPHINLHRQHLTALSRFTQLEVLDVNYHSPFDEELLPTLVNLRHLTRLEVSILPRNPTNASQLDLRDGFQKLTRLVLRGPHAQLTRFILASSTPRLNYLYIAVGSHPADGVHTSLASICRHISPHILTFFRVDLGQFHHPPPSFATLLEPVLPFANLEQVQFSFEGHTPLGDKNLESLARAYPKLHTLILMQSPETMVDPDREPGSVERPTLRGLVELARGCPRLEKLCILDLDASSVPPTESVPLIGHRPLNLCIQNLVGAEGEAKQLAVALVLDRLFPRLKLRSGIHELPGWGANYNPSLEESKNIAKLLRAIQGARMHYPGGL
ncbi:hypothetical protein GSI_04892 [Ganoderma sinense ZZ0214-1]|uniref:F-box domain-containing protein n=1 Tax=Ganoderma sinense ZZ0214-1 TaxID=1077348 RepID=A0A2G8SG63_9APHY|nr:hypothetical protein GSI_04892 [Ganoderma sinense ZZ0214-1]